MRIIKDLIDPETRLPYPEHVPGFGFSDLVCHIARRCISSELVAAQNETSSKSRPIADSITLTLGTNDIFTEKRISSIGPVKSIGARTVIEAGVSIGRDAVIGTEGFIGNGAIIEHGAHLGNRIIMEEGSAVRLTAFVGDKGHLGENAELSYGATLSPGEKILPSEIKY